MPKIFKLDPRLKGNGPEIIDLSLCHLILMDNALFPWVIMVPKRNDVKEIIDLESKDQQTLMKEIALVSHAMKQVFKPDKLNIATLGNMVPQLHVHVIARYTNDSAWPHPAFGKATQPYGISAREKRVIELKNAIQVLAKTVKMEE